MKLGEKSVVVEGGGEGTDGTKPYSYAFMNFSNNRKGGNVFSYGNKFSFQPQEAAQVQAGGSSGDYVHMKLRDERNRSVY